MFLSAPMLVIALLVGCPADETHTDVGYHDTDRVDADVIDGSIPTITLVVSSDSPGSIEAHGTAADLDQSADTLVIELSSAIDGPLGELSPHADGTWSWSGAVGVGIHQIQAAIRDSDGHQASATGRADVVRPNLVPECGISSPEPDRRYDHDAVVSFIGWSNDGDGDPVRLVWTSSATGTLFEGSTANRVLPDGDHTIAVAGDDGRGGTCSAQVTIHVGVVN
jgi:hypothetical protein